MATPRTTLVIPTPSSNSEEEWRVAELIPHWMVSNNGRVYSKTLRRFLAPYTKSGYEILTGRIKGSPPRKRSLVSVHRLVANAFIPNPENKPMVNHLDGNGLNNHVDNLEWATAKENAVHAYQTGLTALRGYNNKLNDDEVREIKLQLSQGVFQKDIAMKFNVSKDTIGKIKRGKYWKHVN